MADAISDLEQQLAQVVSHEELPRLFAAIDEWRHLYGGDKIYVAATCRERRDETVRLLQQQGLKPTEIAKQVGLTPQHVRRLTSQRSGYL